MSTLAYHKDHGMAACTGAVDHSLQYDGVRKIERSGDFLVGFTGHVGRGTAFMDTFSRHISQSQFAWADEAAFLAHVQPLLRTWAKTEGELDADFAVSVLVACARARDVAYEIGLGDIYPFKVLLSGTRPFVASGSGREYAMGAMAAGVTPDEAVFLTQQLDPHTLPSAILVETWGL